MNPKQEALDFKIWQLCNEYEWNLTSKEIAQHLDITLQAVKFSLTRKNWTSRIRTLSNGQMPGNRSPITSFHEIKEELGYHVPKMHND